MTLQTVAPARTEPRALRPDLFAGPFWNVPTVLASVEPGHVVDVTPGRAVLVVKSEQVGTRWVLLGMEHHDPRKSGARPRATRLEFRPGDQVRIRRYL